MHTTLRRVAVVALAAMMLQLTAVQRAAAAEEAAERRGWREWACAIACGSLASQCCLWLPAVCQVCIGAGAFCIDECIEILGGQPDGDCYDVDLGGQVYPCDQGT